MSDIRFNQWLHNSGTGGVSQVDGGHVGIGTTNPLIPVGSGNTAILNVGVVTANSFYGDGSNLSGVQVGGASSLSFNDNIGAYFGNSQDLKIYHDGNHSYIDDQGTGNLRFRSGTLEILNLAGNKTSAIFSSGGGQTLNFNNSTKFVTTNTGIDVTGSVVADDLIVTGTSVVADLKSTNNNYVLGLAGNNSSVKSYFGTDSSGNFLLATGSGVSERLRITSTGQLLVGTGSASNRFKNGNGNGATPKFQFETANVDEQNDISLTFGRNNSYGAEIILAKHRAATVGGYTVVQNGDRLGGINFAGSDGTHFRPAALIQGRVDGTPGTADMPGRLEFLTTADGAATPTERLRITSTGLLQGTSGQHDGGLDLLSGNNNQSTRLRLQSKSSGGTAYNWYLDSARSADRFTIHDGSTSWFNILGTGKVGLGTINPTTLLHISGNSDNGDEACQLTIEDEDTSAGSRVPSIQFKGNGTNTCRIRGSDGSGFQFHIWDGSSQIEKLSITNGGALRVNKIEPLGGLPSGAFGGVIQVKWSANVDNSNYSSGSDVVMQTVNITPTNSSARILIHVCYPSIRSYTTGNTRNRLNQHIKRNGTEIYSLPEMPQWRGANFAGSGVEINHNVAFTDIDSPNTTNQVTYTATWSSVDGHVWNTATGQMVMICVELSG